MIRKTLMLALLTLTAVTVASAAETTKFINVDLTVKEQGQEQPTLVKLRFPLGMISAMKPQIEEAVGSVQVQKDGTNIKSMWSEIRSVGPSRFVEINDPQNKITVDSTTTELVISIDSDLEGKIQVRMPLALGDALFGDTMVDVDALVDLLSNIDYDLVTIEGDQINGRVWVD